MMEERFVIHNLISLKNRTRSYSDHETIDYAIECIKDLNELKSYNRESKCSKCKHEDTICYEESESFYYCEDCIWNFINKFESKE